jgi:hypothetical protein
MVGFEFDFKWLQLGNTAYRLKSPGELAQGAVKTTYIHKRLHSVTPKNSGFKTTPAYPSRIFKSLAAVNITWKNPLLDFSWFLLRLQIVALLLGILIWLLRFMAGL